MGPRLGDWYSISAHLCVESVQARKVTGVPTVTRSICLVFMIGSSVTGPSLTMVVSTPA